MGGQRVQLRVAKKRGLEEMLLKMEEQEKIKEKQDDKKKIWRSWKCMTKKSPKVSSTPFQSFFGFKTLQTIQTVVQ